ncbi:MAG: phosphotransferase [Chloroflexi bacterium]|nr:phosphotransferase [Chloroflexota bacterium]
MSRTGLEPKPPWRSVPRSVREAVKAALGAEVKRAMRVWGGYTPTPTYRLRLQDGQRAFFKAVEPASNAFARAAHLREERVYRELGELIAPWAPAFYGSFQRGDWQVLLLEDLGPKSVPPWTPPLTRAIARALGDFHRATLGTVLPPWLPRAEQQLAAAAWLWERTPDADALRQIAFLAGTQSRDASRWLERASPSLARASRGILEAGAPQAFLHRDVRSDNLRWVKGHLRLFDWPHVGVGPPEYDVAALAQSITVEGGPDPEQVIAWYAERAPIRERVLDAAVAALAGFFADQAWRPDIPGLPRLRPFQRRQLRVTLAWAARRLGLPTPFF